jgi:hypothetical protein
MIKNKIYYRRNLPHYQPPGSTFFVTYRLDGSLPIETIKRLKEEKLDTKDYQWYIDIRKFGAVPHSGFGLGLERLIMWICKLDHIRDAIPFPRTLTRIYP